MSKEDKTLQKKAKRKLRNQRYRQRKKIMENQEWIETCINDATPIWLHGYYVPQNDLYDFFEFITTMDKYDALLSN